MRNIKIKILALSVLSFTNAIYLKHYITIGTWPGRLGDQLLIYCKAKYIEHKYGFSLFLTNNQNTEKYFKDLQVYFKEKLVLTNLKNNTYINTYHENQIIQNLNNPSPIIFNISYYFCCNEWSSLNANKPKTWKNWKHLEDIITTLKKEQKYISKLKNNIYPIKDYSPIKLNKNYINLAVHIRIPSGPDRPMLSEQIYRYADKTHPPKFPPFQFYLNSIEKIAKMYPNKKIAIYLFTGLQSMKNLYKILKNNIKSENIIIYKTPLNKTNNQYKPDIHDILDMAQFDCLIRAQSNFSIISQILGNHKVVISPKKWHWKGDKRLVINESYIRIQGKLKI